MSIWHERVLDVLTDLVKKSQKNKLRIIDVGCDAGIVIREIARRFPDKVDACGLDCRSAELDQGRIIATQEGLKNLTFLNEYFLEMEPLKYGTFDIVIFSEVYEHLLAEDQIKSLRILGTMLNSDGKLVTSVPNGSFLFSIERKKTFDSKYHSGFYNDLHQTEHWLEPRMSELLRIMISLGFEIHDSCYFKLPFSGRNLFVNRISKIVESSSLVSKLLKHFWGHFYIVASKNARSPFFKVEIS